MIEIDLTKFSTLLDMPPDLLMWKILINVGWIPVFIIILWFFKEVWLNYIQDKYYDSIKFVLLAIDIPRGNVQSPKAIENLFTYLAGAHGAISFFDKYWLGVVQLSFSFEVVSIDGYTQYIIRTPEKFRNLVESAIYSQYPDAEITEIDDYTSGIPDKYPDEQYDIWGVDFIQANNPVYPIKTYKEFEHQFGEPEEQFKDPMASLMDLCSSLRPGEQLWFQLLVKPTGFDWPELGDKEISKILKEKTGKDNIVDKMIASFMGWLEAFSESIVTLWADIEDKKKEDKDDSLKMMNLKPKDKKRVEAISEKTAKLGFESKIRFIYVAKNEVKNVAKVVNGFVGFIKQFAALDLNNIKPDMKLTATSTEYFFARRRLNYRKRSIMSAYKARSTWRGKLMGLYNIEELATLWHFPLEAVVKAPLVQKAPGRKSVPPISLPLHDEVKSSALSEIGAAPEDLTPEELFPIDEYDEPEEKKTKGEENSFEVKKEKAKKEPVDFFDNEKDAEPPKNLPIIN